MKITQIKQQLKNSSRVSIFIDSKYSFSLNLDQLLHEKLKKDLKINKNRLKALQKLSDEGKLKSRALNWLLLRPHSTREFHDYLYRKKANEDLILEWIQEFTDKKYLEDYKFAEWLVELRLAKKKSTREISAELFTKGIDREIINKIITDLENIDGATLKKLIVKLQTRPRYHDQNKMITYLMGRGFSYSVIKDALLSLDRES